MIEWVYPAVAVVLLYTVVIPALSLLSLIILHTLDRRAVSAHTWGSGWVWGLIAGPSLLPLAWWSVDALHQLDGAHAFEACVTSHAHGGCAESFWLTAMVVLPTLSWWVRHHRSTARLRRLDFSDARLRGVRVFEVHVAGVPVSTRGLLFPWVAVRHDALETLSQQQLIMALLHEAEHARRFDPLRRWLAVGALAMNPVSRWLQPYFGRWEFGREVESDLRAAHRGDRFALAEAILRVARLGMEPHVCDVGLASSVDAIELRIVILLQDRLPNIARSMTGRLALICVPLIVGAQVGVHHALARLHPVSEGLFLDLFG